MQFRPPPNHRTTTPVQPPAYTAPSSASPSMSADVHEIRNADGAAEEPRSSRRKTTTVALSEAAAAAPAIAAPALVLGAAA